MNVDIEIRGQEALIKKIENISSLAKVDVIDAMNATGIHTRNMLQEETKSQNAIATGKYRDSWKLDMASNEKAETRVYTELKPHYAPDIEFGTRPHFPPVAPLQEWAIKKLHVSQGESRRVGFAIARAIARRGTKARPIFHTATTDVFTYFQKQLVLVANRINQKWRSGI